MPAKRRWKWVIAKFPNGKWCAGWQGNGYIREEFDSFNDARLYVWKRAFLANAH